MRGLCGLLKSKKKIGGYHAFFTDNKLQFDKNIPYIDIGLLSAIDFYNNMEKVRAELAFIFR